MIKTTVAQDDINANNASNAMRFDDYPLHSEVAVSLTRSPLSTVQCWGFGCSATLRSEEAKIAEAALRSEEAKIAGGEVKREITITDATQTALASTGVKVACCMPKVILVSSVLFTSGTQSKI